MMCSKKRGARLLSGNISRHSVLPDELTILMSTVCKAKVAVQAQSLNYCSFPNHHSCAVLLQA